MFQSLSCKRPTRDEQIYLWISVKLSIWIGDFCSKIYNTFIWLIFLWISKMVLFDYEVKIILWMHFCSTNIFWSFQQHFMLSGDGTTFSSWHETNLWPHLVTLRLLSASQRRPYGVRLKVTFERNSRCLLFAHMNSCLYQKRLPLFTFDTWLMWRSKSY